MSQAFDVERLTLSLSKDMVARIQDLADAHDRSRSGMARVLLAHALPEFESAGGASLPLVEGGGPDKTPLRPADVGSLQAKATSAAPNPDAALHGHGAGGGAISALSSAGVEMAAHLHSEHAKRQADAKAAQAREHAEHRAEAIEDTPKALKGEH